MAEQTIDEAKHKQITLAGVGSFLMRRPGGLDKIEIGKQLARVAEGLPIFDPAATALIRTKVLVDVLAESKPANYDFDTAFADEQDAYDFVDVFYQWVNSFRRPRAAAADGTDPASAG